MQLPAALDRAGPVVALWRPATPAPGTLLVEWTDGAGRLVERHLTTLDEALPEVAVRLDLRRARVAANRITARFSPRGAGGETRSEAAFSARPAAGWSQYQVLLWQDQPPEALLALPALGITGTKLLRPLSPAGQDGAARRTEAGLRWYTENLATDFYAPYHRWRPGLPETWLFDRAKALHRRDPANPAAFHREPSLSDPAWLATVAARLADTARDQAPHRPLFHNLADEGGIADLAAAWDFDISPPSLAAMRDWLRQRHGTLAALNAAWGRDFKSWDEVEPSLTQDALRDEAAVPAWMEFKAWMDVAFARAVRTGAEALRRGDPEALAALEGGQVPGWGGYDYGQLAPALDVMEIYDDLALEIARSLNPELRVLTTSFENGAPERRRLWRAWLLGARGNVVWDEAGDVVGPGGRPGPRAAELAPVWRTLTGALGTQLLDARPEPGRTAILYSQPSFRMTWLLDRRAEGGAWTERDAEAETAENAWRAPMRRAAGVLAGLGAQPRWITPEGLAAGDLARHGVRLLVLPHSLALSEEEIVALREFAAGGGLLLADVPPGGRDALGRVRPVPPLADLAASGRLRFPEALGRDDVSPVEISAVLDEAGAHPPLRALEPDGAAAAGLEMRLFRSGGALVAGIQRRDGALSERAIELRLPEPSWSRRLGGEGAATWGDRLGLRLGPEEPVLVALSATPPPAPLLSGPARAAPGDFLEFRVAWDRPMAADAHMLRFDIVDPAGRVVPWLSDTVRMPPEGGRWHLPLAISDPPGRWQVRAMDVMGGGDAIVFLEVN